MVMEGITLSSDQQAKVDAITKKYADETQKMRDDAQNGGDMQAMRTKMGEMRAKQIDELKEVLTSDEQKAAFDKNVDAMKARAANRRPPGQN
jgi:Skp family chaperone for outer membrane proteins